MAYNRAMRSASILAKWFTTACRSAAIDGSVHLLSNKTNWSVSVRVRSRQMAQARSAWSAVCVSAEPATDFSTGPLSGLRRRKEARLATRGDVCSLEDMGVTPKGGELRTLTIDTMTIRVTAHLVCGSSLYPLDVVDLTVANEFVGWLGGWLRVFRKNTAKSIVYKGFWRREWDSNPRYGCPHTRFPSVRLQPLGHPSRSAETAAL